MNFQENLRKEGEREMENDMLRMQRNERMRYVE